MKTTLTALALATSVASCTTVPGNNTQAIVTQIVNTAIQVCGYYADAQAVANLVAITVGGGTIIGQVEQIASEICASATTTPTPTPVTKSGRLRASKNIIVVVRGVPIPGHFTR